MNAQDFINKNEGVSPDRWEKQRGYIETSLPFSLGGEKAIFTNGIQYVVLDDINICYRMVGDSRGYQSWESNSVWIFFHVLKKDASELLNNFYTLS